jgi:ferredoxin
LISLFDNKAAAHCNDSGIPVSRENQKPQSNLKPLTGKATTAPEMWAAVLAA